jgi:hypothetical protein
MYLPTKNCHRSGLRVHVRRRLTRGSTGLTHTATPHPLGDVVVQVDVQLLLVEFRCHGIKYLVKSAFSSIDVAILVSHRLT